MKTNPAGSSTADSSTMPRSRSSFGVIPTVCHIPPLASSVMMLGRSRLPRLGRDRRGGARGSGELLSHAVLRLVVGTVRHGRNIHDVLPGGLPRLLDDPRERAILTGRLGPDLLQHLLWEVETLLALVTDGHLDSVRQLPPEWNGGCSG